MTAVPADMACIEIARPGGPEVLQPARRPVPEPGPGEVLIRVDAAGVNRPDCLQRAGSYPPPPDASDLPGLEVAGEVVALGAGAERWRQGDRLCALVAGGGYAEYAPAPEATCLPLPQGFDMVRAAALPETYMTVWTNVFERGGLAAGETLLVHGGAGGIGTTAIQLAVSRGARVLTTAGNARKCKACVELGAHRAIDYRNEDFLAAALEATEGRGADVILDMVGGDYIVKNLKALAEDGRLVMIAFLAGPKAEVNFAPLMVRRQTITGSTLRPQSIRRKGEIARALETEVWPLLDAGKIAPVIHATMPLDQAADAHRMMESGAHIGKIMLVP